MAIGVVAAVAVDAAGREVAWAARREEVAAAVVDVVRPMVAAVQAAVGMVSAMAAAARAAEE